MTLAMELYLPRDTQKFSPERNLGDALSAIVRHLYPHNTVKRVQSEFDLDLSQAKNVVKGAAGGVVITRMVHTRQRKYGDGWVLWKALGQLLIGEELDAFEQREVLQLIEKAENAKSVSAERRQRREALAARTSDLLNTEYRSFVEQSRRSNG